MAHSKAAPPQLRNVDDPVPERVARSTHGYGPRIAPVLSRTPRDGELSFCRGGATYYTPPAALPGWQWTNPEDPHCRCIDVFPDNLRHHPRWSSALRDVPVGTIYRANRCNLFARRGGPGKRQGCYHGDKCRYCHLHPVDPKTNPEDKRWQNFGKRERAAIRQSFDPDRQFWTHAISPMLRAVEEDAMFFTQPAEPIGDICIFVMGVHRLMEDMVTTRRRWARALHIEESHIGFAWCADRQVEGVTHFSRREILDKMGWLGHICQTKAFVTRFPWMAQKVQCKGFLFMENDAVPLAGLRGRWPQLASLLTPLDTWCWVGFYTQNSKTTWERPALDLMEGAHRDMKWPHSCGSGEDWDLPIKGATALYCDRDALPSVADKMRISMPHAMGMDTVVLNKDWWFPNIQWLSQSVAGQDGYMWSDLSNRHWKPGVNLIQEPRTRVLDNLRVRSSQEHPWFRRHADKVVASRLRRHPPEREFPGSEPFDWLTKDPMGMMSKQPQWPNPQYTDAVAEERRGRASGYVDMRANWSEVLPLAEEARGNRRHQSSSSSQWLQGNEQERQ